MELLKSYKIWGLENRNAPIRVVSPLKKNEIITHFEITSLDHTANLYFAIASILTLGYKGLTDKIPLNDPFIGNPDILTE
jgi:glutamine synthetase